jgi:hypothetical protein
MVYTAGLAIFYTTTQAEQHFLRCHTNTLTHAFPPTGREQKHITLILMGEQFFTWHPSVRITSAWSICVNMDHLLE